VFFVLIMFADFEPTEDAAVAFAYLILISTALVAGPVAFQRIGNLSSSMTLASAAGGGGGSSKKKG